jgi:S1-C subfamily serine protease
VLRGTLEMGPAIKLAKADPEIGIAVASLGYGFGLEQPMFRIGNVSHARIEIEELSGPFVMIDANYIGGQSGGPVVNVNGELVSIVQRGAAGFGFGVGVDTIRDKVGRYFE